VSIDRRLREGFERSASAIGPRDHAALERVTVRARRHVMVRRMTSTVMVALAVGGLALGGPKVLDAFREGRQLEPVQEPTPSPRVPGDASITGAYARTLGNEDAAIRSNGMVGEWTITFRSDGVLDVSSPASFQESRSGYSFEVSGSQFRTDLFRTDVCNDLLPGRYRWQRSGNRLTFEVVDDACPARAALFASGPWHKSR
jgi:hypothetical protein